MSIIVTGANGFVGYNLIPKLKARFEGFNIIALHRSSLINEVDGVIFKQVDLNIIESIIEIINDFSPKYIIHLAAESSVAISWDQPVRSFNNNINIYLNLIDAVRQSNFNPLILSIGSSEIYGKVLRLNVPLNEKSIINPISPYAVARASQEAISKVYVEGFGLKIIMTRSFNHLGIGQDLRFFIPSVIKQIFDSNLSSLNLGNLDIVRDYIDIDDVTNAYIELLTKGKSGQVYNVCNGNGHTLKQIVLKAMETANIFKPIRSNNSLLRPNDNPIIIGDNSKLKNLTDWEPEFSLEISLKKIIEHEKT